MEKINVKKRYTYEDYLSWSDNQRYELIDGTAYMMASPSIAHQRISLKLLRLAGNFLDGKPCEVFHAPLDLCFAEELKSDTVVQPDIMIVCEKEKIKGNRIVGAPTLIIEILSPGTINRDTLTKRNLYEQKGVKEYWLVSPQEKNIRQCVLENEHYTDRLIDNDHIASTSINGFSVQIDELFENIE